ncbi:phosphate butyryltransferase [Thermolongibacillus altinsuensis]|uniref:phosphate butyryltransferase n=1 Tax=Thermolongibacillus altinsuensis TaxID=575256 RepID=UPI0025565E83|nr:phosphate butyryltransferase [Thermolongibacillus altinsuensis]
MKLESLITKATQLAEATVAVAAAEDSEVIKAVIQTLQSGFGQFLLYGDEPKIYDLLGEYAHYVESGNIRIIHADSKAEAAELAVRAVHGNEANVLMKGNVPTATILKAVLHKEYGLRTGNVLSHVAVFEVPNYDRYIIVTDAAMNIAPDLQQKAEIVANAVKVAKAIGIEKPKVAPLAAVEVVNPAMPATIDAAALSLMSQRGQLTDCIVDGPLALDNAVSIESAQHKGIRSEVAGRADILLVPNIETGNVLYKSLVYFANAKVGAIIAGAKAPIVLTSRADSAESKLYSLALAICATN